MKKTLSLSENTFHGTFLVMKLTKDQLDIKINSPGPEMAMESEQKTVEHYNRGLVVQIEGADPSESQPHQTQLQVVPVLSSLYLSLISFSYFTFPGAPYRIFLLLLPWLSCHFYLVGITITSTVSQEVSFHEINSECILNPSL